MSLVQLYQNELNDQRYWNETLTNSIRFVAYADKHTGTLYEIESDKVFDYGLEANSSNLTIKTAYFSDPHIIRSTPLGFNLHEIDSRAIYLKYINEFWINNQEVIRGILEFSIQEVNRDKLFTAEQLAKAVREKFSNQSSWSKMLEITRRIVEMLVEERAVHEGKKQGEPCLSESPNSKKLLEENRYLFVQK